MLSYILFYEESSEFSYIQDCSGKIIIGDELNDILTKLKTTAEVCENNILKHNKLCDIYPRGVIPNPNCQNFKTNRYLYLIQSGKNIFKIGVAKNVEMRLKDLQSINSAKLKLVKKCYTEDPFKKENFLHNKFKDKRINNEWFHLDESDKTFIINYFDKENLK